MTKLISKVQYKNFETGEFVDEQERDYESTIQLIEKFPWAEQRKKIVISLTNPSITIAGRNNDFLKLSVFYNQKYVLHYLDENQVLFTRSFIDVKGSYDYIRKYFELPVFDPFEFRKEKTWFQHDLKHFITQDFQYVVTPKVIKKYLWATSGGNFLISIVFIVFMLLKMRPGPPITFLFMFIIMFLIGGGFNLVLFFNYYNQVKSKILIMSKGNNIFYFGPIGNPVKYDKENVLSYTVIRSQGYRNPISGFGIVAIEFMDGTCLKIPNLLVDDYDLVNKLSGIPGEEKNKFPYLHAE